MKANATIKHEFGADETGVSPVVATLMLVLVAAGAAVGIGVFMNDFQDTSTKDVSTPSDAGTLTIGGSSTVYEFSLAAIPEFEAFMKQRGTPVSVELEKGGSGAGRQAVGLCLVDIGSSSSPVPASEKQIYPDCDGNGAKDFGIELKIHKVATDGVVFAMHNDNNHCAAALSLTQTEAYELYATNVENHGGAAGPVISSPTLDAVDDDVIRWGELSDENGDPCDQVDADQPVILFDRKDPGGTSEIASEKLLGQKQKQLEDAGITLPDSFQGDGNQGVWDVVTSNATNRENGLFFTSFGYAIAQGADVQAFGIDNTPIVPSASDIGDETYEATRPILYITAGEPTGFAKLWIDFVLNPHKNQLFAEEADFESVY